jgi:hypothetical protein
VSAMASQDPTATDQRCCTGCARVYVYNICIYGICLQALGVPLEDPKKMTRLWAHEVLRVFHDRLVSDEDRSWFQNLLKVGLRVCVCLAWLCLLVVLGQCSDDAVLGCMHVWGLGMLLRAWRCADALVRLRCIPACGGGVVPIRCSGLGQVHTSSRCFARLLLLLLLCVCAGDGEQAPRPQVRQRV